MQVGDAVKLREGVAFGQRRELVGEVGKVGEVHEVDGETCCTVIYEDRKCLIWDARASDFEAAGPTLH